MQETGITYDLCQAVFPLAVVEPFLPSNIPSLHPSVSCSNREAAYITLTCRGFKPSNNNLYYYHAHNISQVYYIDILLIFFHHLKFYLLFFSDVNENHLLPFFIIIWNFQVGLFIILLTLYLCITSMVITGEG